MTDRTEDPMNASAHSTDFSSKSAPDTDAHGATDTKARLIDLVDAVVRLAKARPFPALAAAVIAGFVVGGALSFRGGRVILAAGARHAGQELLKQLI
jgi:hypothetical protein